MIKGMHDFLQALRRPGAADRYDVETDAENVENDEKSQNELLIFIANKKLISCIYVLEAQVEHARPSRLEQNNHNDELNHRLPDKHDL